MKRVELNRGFTIVELMISLTILSLILLLSTSVIVQIGKIYAKGSNMATTQNTARNLVASLTAQLQLGGSTPVYFPASPNPSAANQSNAGAICIGSQRYSYVLNHQLTTKSTDHVLWKDVMNGASQCQPISPLDGTSANPSDTFNTSSPNNGVELMPVNTRLIDFDVIESSGVYTVTVGVAYGDDDLLNYTPRSGTTPAQANCKGGDGSSYCAVSILSKTVVPRIIK